MNSEERKAYWYDILQRHSETDSSVTVVEFCKTEGVSSRQFTSWSQRLHYQVRKRTFERGHAPASKLQLDTKNRRSHRGYEFLSTRTLRCVESCVHFDSCPEAGKSEDCVILDGFLMDARERLLTQPSIDADRDSLLIDRIIKTLAVVTLIEWWSFKRGVITEGKDGTWNLNTALSTSYLAYSNSLTRLLRDAGIGPMAAKQLGIKAPIPSGMEKWLYQP